MDAVEVGRARTFKLFFIQKAEFFGLLATAVFCAIYFSIAHISPKNYVKDVQSMQCQQPNYSEGIGFSLYKQHLDNPTRKYHKFRLAEYLLYKRSGVYDCWFPLNHLNETGVQCEDYMELRENLMPVVFFPGFSDAADSLQFLAKMLRERSKEARRTFSWLTLDFFQGSAYSSDERLRLHIDHSYDVAHRVEMTFPEERAVYICHGVGSGICYWMANIYSANVSLVLLESTPSKLPGYYTGEIKKWLANNLKTSENSEPFTPGIISVESGFDDTSVDPSWLTWTEERIPIWTIDGVPDNGVSAKGMHKCKPYLDWVADLLVAFNKNEEIKERKEPGKFFLQNFYNEWQSKKTILLPDNWKSDTQKDLKTVQIGGKYNFVVNRSLWLDVDVQRNTSVVLQITAPCLTAATIIRRQKFIKRKEALFNSSLFEFGIYQLKSFEQVRILLESNTECHVVIETSPWWLELTQKFYYGMVLDPHHFWVAAYVTFVFLAVLESDKRSYRWEHQLYVYTVFILAALYHTFHNFGFKHPGLICGAGCSIAVHFVCSTCHEYVFMRQARRSLDSILRKPQRLFMKLVGLLLFCVVSSPGSAFLTITMYAWTIRPMLLPTAVVSQIPIINKMLYQPLFWRSATLSLMSGAYRPTGTGAVTISITIWFLTDWLGWAGAQEEMSRQHFHMIAYPVFILQFICSSWPLDFHYAAGLLILALNQRSVQNVPRQIFGVVDRESLERAYRRQDDENVR